jgi:hypothetical protein
MLQEVTHAMELKVPRSTMADSLPLYAPSKRLRYGRHIKTHYGAETFSS